MSDSAAPTAPAKLQRAQTAPSKSSEVTQPPPARNKLTRSGSASGMPGFYQNLSGNKRKSRTNTDKQPAAAPAESMAALAVQATANRTSPRALPKAVYKEEEEDDAATAALLGLSRAASQLIGSPVLTATNGEAKPQQRSSTILGTTYTAGGASATKASPGAKRPRGPRQPARRRGAGKAADEPLLDIKLPEGNGPWEGIVVTLRHGKYKGKTAQVLGLAKKKYRVQVEGLEYQLEFYPSYVGLPEPAPVDDAASRSADNKSSGTGNTATETVALMAQGKHAIQRMSSWQSHGTTILMAGSPVNSAGMTRMISGDSNNSSTVSKPTSLDEYRSWIGKKVRVKRGKYQGRYAWVLGLACEKLRVVVENVQHQLEYYPTMFEPPQELDQPAPQATGDGALAASPAPVALPVLMPPKATVKTKFTQPAVASENNPSSTLTEAMGKLTAESNSASIENVLKIQTETLVSALQPANLRMDSMPAISDKLLRSGSSADAEPTETNKQAAVKLLAGGKWKGAASSDAPMAATMESAAPTLMKSALMRMHTGGSSS